MARNRKHSDEELISIAKTYEEFFTTKDEWDTFAKEHSLPRTNMYIKYLGPWDSIKKRISELQVEQNPIQYNAQEIAEKEFLEVNSEETEKESDDFPDETRPVIDESFFYEMQRNINQEFSQYAQNNLDMLNGFKRSMEEKNDAQELLLQLIAELIVKQSDMMKPITRELKIVKQSYESLERQFENQTSMIKEMQQVLNEQAESIEELKKENEEKSLGFWDKISRNKS